MLTGDWVHLAVSNIPTRLVYLNGQQQVESCGYFGGLNQTQGGSANIGNRLGASSLTPGVGNRNGNGPNEGFVGLVDELRLYTRALNATEIAEIYACHPAKFSPPPPLCRCATFK